jgi:hypothetical protein
MEKATQTLAERLRIKRRQTFIEKHEVCVLQKRPRDIETAPFAV